MAYHLYKKHMILNMGTVGISLCLFAACAYWYINRTQIRDQINYSIHMNSANEGKVMISILRRARPTTNAGDIRPVAMVVGPMYGISIEEDRKKRIIEIAGDTTILCDFSKDQVLLAYSFRLLGEKTGYYQGYIDVPGLINSEQNFFFHITESDHVVWKSREEVR